MNRLLFICFFLISSVTAFAQFPDTATLNQYFRDTLRDRRPDKITVAQLQKAFLGVTSFLQGGGSTTPDTLTREAAEGLVQDSLLVEGKLYFITGVDQNLYGGTNILLKAITSYKFAVDGLGYFYNPDYSSGEYQIWDGEITEVTVNEMEQRLYPGEYFLTGEGQYGMWIKEGLIFATGDGEPWTTGTFTITGQNSGRTAEIEVTELPSYEADTKVIWGGRIWNNITGNTGRRQNPFQLNEEDWEIQPYTAPGYMLAIDPIKYDWTNNLILGRREEEGDNEVYSTYYWIADNSGENPIKSFQWGRPYDIMEGRGIGSQRIINSLNQNINFKGQYQINIDMSNSYQTEMYFDNDSYQENIKLEQGSQQSSLFFINGGQSKLHLYSSTQGSATLYQSSQYGFNFIRGVQYNFNLDNYTQENYNLWGFMWDREYAFFQGGSEVGIYKFGPPPEDESPDQVFLRTQEADVSTQYQSSSEVYATGLDFDVEEGQSYAFEYELYVQNYIASTTMLLNVIAPTVQSMTTFFTCANINDGSIVTSVNTMSGSGTIPISGSGNYYHVRISGVMIGVAEGTVTLGVAPDNAPYSGEITIKTGSFAKFTKFPYYPPPSE